MRQLKDITHEVEALPAEQQLEVFDFIAFLKMKQASEKSQTRPKAANSQEIENFFRSFEIDVSGYRFDREEANAR